MLELFLPKMQVNNVYELTPELLKKNLIKGIIVDLDNTLAAWNVAHPDEATIQWIEGMIKSDIKVVIFSNNNKKRVDKFVENLDVHSIPNANKPLSKQFKQAQKWLGLSEGEIAVIGDQLLTDILGGNRVGFFTILVTPLVQSDAAITTFNRQTEKLILNHFYRKGKLVRGNTNE